MKIEISKLSQFNWREQRENHSADSLHIGCECTTAMAEARNIDLNPRFRQVTEALEVCGLQGFGILWTKKVQKHIDAMVDFGMFFLRV